MQQSTNINMLMQQQQKIMTKCKVRDIWTFITMATVILGMIPIISTIVGIADFLWFIVFIVLYFSIKNDRLLLESMIHNTDHNELKTWNDGYNAYSYNPSHRTVGNWKNVFLHYQDSNVQHLIQERTRLEQKRDKWTFIYMICGVVATIVMISVLFASIGAILNTDPDKASSKSIIDTLGPAFGVLVAVWLVILAMWITWIVIYISSYNSINRIEMNLTTMTFPEHDDHSSASEEHSNQQPNQQ